MAHLMPQHREARTGMGRGDGEESVLALVIMPSPEGYGHPDSTGLGTRVSSDFP